MPELPEVESVRRGLLPVLEGRVIDRVQLRRPDLRYPLPREFARRLRKRRVKTLSRRAKYLLAELDDGEILLMHLGMSGSFRIEGRQRRAPDSLYYTRRRDPTHDHVVFHLQDGARIVYNDPRRFGFMLLVRPEERQSHPFLARLGLEPVGDEFSAAALAPRLAGRKAPLKAALGDQRVIAGLGNIYVCEALWRAKLDPRRSASTLVRWNGRPSASLERLVDAVRAVITDAITAGGSTLRDYAQADGTLGLFQHRFAVYDREGKRCLRPECRGTIKRIVQSGRSTFYCPRCQR
jgi:formamidopyrimidine-DNA glycosylase